VSGPDFGDDESACCNPADVRGVVRETHYGPTSPVRPSRRRRERSHKKSRRPTRNRNWRRRIGGLAFTRCITPDERNPPGWWASAGASAPSVVAGPRVL